MSTDKSSPVQQTMSWYQSDAIASLQFIDIADTTRPRIQGMSLTA